MAARLPMLRRVAPEAVSLRLEVWLAMHERLRATRRVQLVFEHLAEALRRHVEGRPGKGPGQGRR